jgi:tetratricopeptide (TPR) repeat protein
MWMQRNIERLSSFDRPIFVEAADEYGFPYIASELRDIHPHVVWMSLDPEDAGDKIRQGNKLANATSLAFSSPLFGTGLPYSYGLSVLRKHLDILAPITLILCNAEFSTPLATALLAFACSEAKVILHFHKVPSHFERPRKSTIISSADLRIDRRDAERIARGRVPDDSIDAMLSQSRGAYEGFVSLLNDRLGLPAMLRPSPTGSVALTDLPRADVVGLVDALVESGFWIEAFEVSARNVPERAREIVDKAGEAYFARGLFDQFWNVFKLLPESVVLDERMAYWRYAAAVATNNHRRVQPEVREYLQSNIAAELRALVAISMPSSTMLKEAEQAFQAKENAVTTRALGFAYAVSGDPISGIKYLHLANGHARTEDNKHLIVATSNELAVAYQLAGKYREAHRWASWALRQFTDLGMNEELRRLFIISEVAFSALLIDQVESVSSLLDSITIPPELHGIPSVEGIVSTLGDYSTLRGMPELGLQYARINFENLPEQSRGYGTLGMVRALLALDRTAEAVEVANATYCSVFDSTEVEQLRASLALGIALAACSPKESLAYLARAHEGFRVSLNAPYLAQATIVLARVYLELGEPDEARKTLALGEVSLRELTESGWLLLGGPEEQFHQVWDLWNEDTTPVELRFMGGRKIRIQHRTRDYPLRWCEILAVLAFHPHGLNGERLGVLLYGDGGNMSTLKANVSRMRKDVPVSSRPYRIELPFTADFVELDRALREGRVREALELFHGPLLPESESPFVVELRDYLEETLRQAALTSGDVEVLLSLARKLGDDLELWEAASQQLSQNDPLLPLAKAHVKRIQRSWGG